MVKKILILLIFVGILLNGCVEAQYNLLNNLSNLSKINKTIIEKEITNENLIVSPNCQSNMTYLNKEECNCNSTWVINSHIHSFCTPEKTTTFSCRRLENHNIIGEVNVFFKSATTLEKAESIVNKYGGKVLVYTCWFENRESPYLTTFVQEGKEQKFIDSVGNESFVESAHQNFYATTQ